MKDQIHHLTASLSRKNDYLKKNTGWIGLGQLLGTFISLLALIVLANTLEQNVFGTYQYLLALVGTIAAISMTGMGDTIVRTISKHPELKHELLAYSKKLVRIGSLAGTLIALGASAYYLFQGNLLFAVFIALGAAAMLQMKFAALFRYVYISEGNFKLDSLVKITQSIVPTAAVFICILFTHELAWLLTAFYASGVMATFIISRLYYHKTRPSSFSNLPSDVREDHKKIAINQSLINILFVLVSNLDKLLLFQLLGPTTLATYVLAINIPNRIRNYCRDYAVLLLPIFSQQTPRSVRADINRKTLLTLLLLAIPVLMYIIAAELCFPIVFPDYADAVFLSQLYALSILGTAVATPYAALKSHASSKTLWQFSISFNTFQLLLLVSFIISFGVVGAIFSRIIGLLLSIPLALFFVHKSVTN